LLLVCTQATLFLAKTLLVSNFNFSERFKDFKSTVKFKLPALRDRMEASLLAEPL
jgi:hypothetical protein